MIVQKFGGTSMGSVQSIRAQVTPIVRQAVQKKQRPVVVVSAMSGVTNALLALADSAVHHHRVDEDLISSLKARHEEVLKSIGGEHAAWGREQITVELVELTSFLKALSTVGELSPRSRDAVLSVGEKLSAILMTASLQSEAIAAEYVDLAHVVPDTLSLDTQNYWADVQRRFGNRLSQLPAQTVPVLTGFFGDLEGGMIEAVGRGYSDYCASLAGAAVGASEIQIWTDVDGVLSADPRLVKDAAIIERLSFDETAELAHFGAKVLHPYSVRPAVEAGIPLRVLNTFRPECPGTWIENEAELTDRPFKSIASKTGVTVVRVTTARMLLAAGISGACRGCFRPS